MYLVISESFIEAVFPEYVGPKMFDKLVINRTDENNSIVSNLYDNLPIGTPNCYLKNEYNVWLGFPCTIL